VRDIEVDLNSQVYAATDEGLMKWDGSGWITLNGLPTDDITALAIDRSSSPGIVYAGTGEDGVFVSEDGGNTWTSFNEGLGNLSITKLAISDSLPKMLYAGTAYGGIWSEVLDTCDVNGDGEVTPQDALCAFQKYLGICPTACGPCEEISCDVNGDGQCTPADALEIFKESLGMPSVCSQ